MSHRSSKLTASGIPDSKYDHCTQVLEKIYGEDHDMREEYKEFANVVLKNLGLRLLERDCRGFPFRKPQRENEESRARIRRLAGAHHAANQQRVANANPAAAAANANAGNVGNEVIDPSPPVIIAPLGNANAGNVGK